MTRTALPLTVGTVPTSRTARDAPLLLRPLRLHLRPRTARTTGQQPGLVDGAWWPYTDDLVTELAPLLAETARSGYQVHRISYSLGAWQPVPRKLQLAGALVRLGGYRTQPASVIHLIDSSGTAPLVLVVVPPRSRPEVGEAALHLATSSTSLDAAGVLAEARQDHLA